MAKISNKNTGKRRATKLIKDKAIVNFLLEHMKPTKIDFSKIKIPFFLAFLEREKNPIPNPQSPQSQKSPIPKVPNPKSPQSHNN